MTIAEKRFFHLAPTGAACARLEEAEHYFLAGNLNEALAAAQQAWRECPMEPDVFRVLAYIHMARGEYPPAAQAAYQAVVIDGENAASYATLAQVYVTFHMVAQAEETLNMALERYADDPTLLALAADVRFRRRRDGQAVELVTRALEHNPHDGYAKALLGSHHLRRKHYTAAYSLLQEAVEAYPQRWDYQRDYGIAALHLREYDTALDMLARSFGLNPADLNTKRHLAYALRLQVKPIPLQWELSFFFFNTGWLAWVLAIAGSVLLLLGVVWLAIINGTQEWNTAWQAYLYLLGGVALYALVGSGINMRSRKGPRFDSWLLRQLEQRGLWRG